MLPDRCVLLGLKLFSLFLLITCSVELVRPAIHRSLLCQYGQLHLFFFFFYQAAVVLTWPQIIALTELRQLAAIISSYN